MAEDEMVGRHEFGETPGVGDGQGGLACCDSWGRKESDTTERLSWTGRAFPDSSSNLLAISSVFLTSFYFSDLKNI